MEGRVDAKAFRLFRHLVHALAAFDKRHAAAGGRLTSADRSEIRGLLSGSDAAVHKLATLAPQLKNAVDDVVDQAFTHGLRGVMILSIVLSALSIWPALWGATRRARPLGGHPRLPHPLWPRLWHRPRTAEPER